MKTLIRSLHFAFIATAFALVAQQPDTDPASAFPLQGSWRWNFTMPDGTIIRPRLKIKKEDGIISGSTRFRPEDEASITNVSVTGDQLRFQVIRKREDQNIVTTYSGAWSSNNIKGKIESNWAGDLQSFPWEAQRANIGVEGVWRWTNVIPGTFGRGGRGGRFGGGGEGATSTNNTLTNLVATVGTNTNIGATNRAAGGGGGRGGRGGFFETRVELEQLGEKITGKTVGRGFGGGTSITNGVVTNGIVYFEIERTFGAIKSLTKFKGTQKGDTIKGTMETEIDEEPHEGPWDANRVD